MSEMKIDDLDLVYLIAPVQADGGVLPVSAQGVVLRAYDGGAAFAAEFTTPFHTIATVKLSEIRKRS